MIDRHRKNVWMGYGQVLRYHLRTRMFYIVIAELGLSVPHLVGLLVFVA
jgi:hypothetical protein